MSSFFSLNPTFETLCSPRNCTVTDDQKIYETTFFEKTFENLHHANFVTHHRDKICDNICDFLTHNAQATRLYQERRALSEGFKTFGVTENSASSRLLMLRIMNSDLEKEIKTCPSNAVEQTLPPVLINLPRGTNDYMDDSPASMTFSSIPLINIKSYCFEYDIHRFSDEKDWEREAQQKINKHPALFWYHRDQYCREISQTTLAQGQAEKWGVLKYDQSMLRRVGEAQKNNEYLKEVVANCNAKKGK